MSGPRAVTRPAPAALLLLLLSAISGAEQPPSFHRPRLQVPESLAPFLPHVTPGADAFPAEKEAAELAGRLAELGRALQAEPRSERQALERLVSPEFRAGRLTPSAEVAVVEGPALHLHRASALSDRLDRDVGAFAADLRGLLQEIRRVEVAEFLITAIELEREKGLADTDVRFDIVGPGVSCWRAQRSGTWRLRWSRGADGVWRVVAWTAQRQVRSHAGSALFTEITGTALGGDEAYRRQLSSGLDAWLASIDSVLSRDTIGHHGVSVGDADGDGLDDLYVSQPSGLPNRLLRARGDGTFEDATAQAGLAVLDDTSQSLFMDVENDGDQDLVLATGIGPLLFRNDGKGRFTQVPDAFRLQDGLKGSLVSMSAADYDRDGFLDLYLCTYLYFMGASEDKAGPPTPYHDAQNGPPNVLLRNDRSGRFVDVTAGSGLDRNNDRFSLAAAWADYDADGWPDLLVANDFGRKNLYHSRGMRGGRVTFEDVAAQAGVEDHGAGMSAAWLDYDNDGRLDIYTGNMWSDAGLRVTADPNFMPAAPPEVRALYRRHARGNSLFRNRGDGRFDDVTLAARAEMGRWAWSSDALDFDADGWEDLYVTNGMITRENEADLDGFLWRQLIARSPLTRVTGTDYDDVWRAINRFLPDRSWARHHRHVLLRNDGQGSFDDVSGTAGLDLDQDGRSFAAFDYDGDGDPDLATMAARSAPQLRLFRNDAVSGHAKLALRLTGTRSNRDAVGAQVSVETDRLRCTRIVQAGSGFISQHARELLFGLGTSRRVRRLSVRWPSGQTQVFSDLAVNQRLRLEEGGAPRSEPLAGAAAGAGAAAPSGSPPPAASWLYEPFPAPPFALSDLAGRPRSLSALSGRPALILFWASDAPASRLALDAVAAGGAALASAGVGVLAIALDPPRERERVEAAAQTLAGVPVIVADEELAGAWAILTRHLFVGPQDMRLPTAFLLDVRGEIVKVYRGTIPIPELLADVPRIEAPAAERLARALPFEGRLYSAPGERNDVQYGRELLEQGFEAPALDVFARAANRRAGAFTLYTLGTLLAKTGRTAQAIRAFERALEAKPELSEASNDLGAILAQTGDVAGAIARFRAALASTPDYPDALNNLGYALLLTGREQEAAELYQKALTLEPGFPEALNNLGLLHARRGELAQAEPYFREALAKRPGYGEAANNLALVLVSRGEVEAAVALLQRQLAEDPEHEATYVTLAKVYLTTQRTREGLEIVERLLQRNPTHPLALEIARQFKAR